MHALHEGQTAGPHRQAGGQHSEGGRSGRVAKVLATVFVRKHGSDDKVAAGAAAEVGGIELVRADRRACACVPTILGYSFVAHIPQQRTQAFIGIQLQ